MARKANVTKIRAFMERNPDAKPAHIAKALKVPVVQVYNLRARMAKTKSVPVVLDEVTNITPAQWQTIAYAVTKGRTQPTAGRHTLPKAPKGIWATVIGWFK